MGSRVDGMGLGCTNPNLTSRFPKAPDPLKIGLQTQTQDPRPSLKIFIYLYLSIYLLHISRIKEILNLTPLSL